MPPKFNLRTFKLNLRDNNKTKVVMKRKAYGFCDNNYFDIRLLGLYDSPTDVGWTLNDSLMSRNVYTYPSTQEYRPQAILVTIHIQTVIWIVPQELKGKHIRHINIWRISVTILLPDSISFIILLVPYSVMCFQNDSGRCTLSNVFAAANSGAMSSGE